RDEGRGKEAVRTLRLMPDGKRIVTAGGGDVVRLIDLATGKQVEALSAGEKAGQALIVVPSPDGGHIAGGGDDGVLRLWDGEWARLTARFSGPEGAVRALAFTADGKRLISGGDERTIRVWDVATGRQLQRIAEAHEERVTCVAPLPGEGGVLTAGHDGWLK